MCAALLQVNPGMGKALSDLLSYTGDDVEDVFCLTFEATSEAFGTAALRCAVTVRSAVVSNAHLVKPRGCTTRYTLFRTAMYSQ